jgi:hypothetical protein
VRGQKAGTHMEGAVPGWDVVLLRPLAIDLERDLYGT